eukprot:2062975-Heterocapsa_arctica.AAC.1
MARGPLGVHIGDSGLGIRQAITGNEAPRLRLWNMVAPRTWNQLTAAKALRDAGATEVNIERFYFTRRPWGTTFLFKAIASLDHIIILADARDGSPIAEVIAT